MQVFDILKRIEVLPEENLEHLEEFVSAEEKGYPSILHPLKIVADFDDETNKLRGYTSYRDFGKFFFVGNSFVFDKEGGVFGRLVSHRNDTIIGKDTPKITLLNPLKGTDLSRLSSYVERRGGVKITEYSQVDDIMDEETYDEFKKLPMYRYPPLKDDSTKKAKDMAVNKPMPQITRRKKVIRSGDKGRTIQGKNFPEWKEILRKPQNKTLLKQKRKKLC